MKKIELHHMFGCYNITEIEKEWKKYKCPVEYNHISLEQLFTNDYSLYMSTRQDGKTTNALLIGLVLFKLYDILPCVIRNDTNQITLSNINALYDVVIDNGYIARLFDNEFNTVVYLNRERSFYLAYRGESGDLEYKDNKPCCFVASNEKWKDYKSSKNLAKCLLIIWDEFLDTDRFTCSIVNELFNNIASFTHMNPNAHVIGLSNTVNPYSQVFEDFVITDDVTYMDFGDSKNIKSKLGTTFYIKLLSLSKKKKENLEKKQIKFFGINNKKFANFTGVQAWQGKEYRHLEEKPTTQEILYFIKHRDKYMTVYFCELPDKLPVFLVSKCSFIPDNRTIILCNNPVLVNEMTINAFQFKPLYNAIHDGRVCVTTNEIGLLLDDYFATNGIKW